MSYSSEVLADSPLGWWKLDEASGTTAADSSGNGRSLTLHGSVTPGAAVLRPGGGTSFDFSGSAGSYLDIAFVAWMQTASFTWEAWVNLDSVSSYRGLVSRDAASPRGPAWYLTSGKENLYQTTDHLGTATQSITTLYHLAVTYDNATGTVVFYVNGAVDATLTGQSFNNTNSQPLVVGGSYGGTGAVTLLLDGKMCDVAAYGSALSAARIAAHYTAGTAVAASATASLSLVASSTAGSQPASGTASLDLTASGTPNARPTAAAALSLTAGSSGAARATATATLTLTATARAAALYTGDTSNFYNGLDLQGAAEVTITTPPAAPPGPVVAVKVDKAIPFPKPDLVKGRPT